MLPLFRRIGSRFLWLLGFTGTVHWALTTGLGVVVSVLFSAYALAQNMPLLLLVVLFVGTFLIAVGLINHTPGWWVALRDQMDEEKQRREQEALDAYRTQMEQWLHDANSPLSQLPPDHPVRASAQDRTIDILPKLSPNGKRSVVRLLNKHGLIKRRFPTISLAHADLTRADLSRLTLTDTAMLHANLRGANLSDTRLCNYAATDADKLKMLAVGHFMIRYLSQPTNVSELIGCDLSGAVLRGAEIAGCTLLAADFAGADLEEADLRATDLRHTRNLTQRQIESAYGSNGQQGGTPDTRLPSHLKAPKLWERPISQQLAVRRGKS